MTEQPTVESSEVDRWRAVLWLVVLTAAFLVNNLLVGSLFDLPPQRKLLQSVLLGTVIGVIIGQLNLISIWAAIAEGPLIVRLPWAYLLVVVIWASVVTGNLIAGGIDSEALWTLGTLLAAGCTVAQIPLWIASRRFRWRLLGPGTSEAQAQDSRFNLKHVFTGTFLLTLVLGFCRFLFLDVDGDVRLIADVDLYVGLSVMAVVNLLTVVPAIWAAFLLPMSWKSAILAVAAVLIITVVQCLIFVSLFGSGLDIEDFTALGSINLAQVIAVYLTLRGLRRVGFRLVRLPVAGFRVASVGAE